jgi:D-lactate dehydrogenase (cytochrome)
LQVKACNAYSKLSLPEKPLLLLEFHGTEAGVAEQSQRFGEIAADLGGGPFEWTTKAEERTRLWQARHDGYFAACALRPGARSVATDICVPISRLAECVTETQREVVERKLVAPIVGHVGDGNFHVALMVDTEDAAEMKSVKAFMERLTERAIAMGGTCTGEHGVGQGKMKYLLAEHGAPAMAAMRAVKQALDPDNIMNPGKMLPQA